MFRFESDEIKLILRVLFVEEGRQRLTFQVQVHDGLLGIIGIKITRL